MKINWNPNDYRNNSLAQSVWAKNLISRIGVKEDSCVIDIGSSRKTCFKTARKVLPDDVDARSRAAFPKH
jgi:hypothetical protein